MIASLHHPIVKHIVKLRENRKYRQEQGVVVVSGSKLVKEISNLYQPLMLFIEVGSSYSNNLSFGLSSLDSEEFAPQILGFSDEVNGQGPFTSLKSTRGASKLTESEGEKPKTQVNNSENVYTVTSSVLKKMTGLPSPEPIVALFPLPQPHPLVDKAPLLVLDAIRDPGNLGTLVRTALALGWQGVFFLPTCVDPFHDKVLRASRGALFKLPWKSGSLEELETFSQLQNLSIWIADKEGQMLDNLSPSKKTILLLSNEAKGVQTKVAALGQKITIPMSGEMESLNVAIAGAILMYQMIIPIPPQELFFGNAKAPVIDRS